MKLPGKANVIIKTRGSGALTTQDLSFSRDQIIQKDLPEWLINHRLQSWTLYQDTPFPTQTDEAWRRTDIRNLKKDALEITDYSNYGTISSVPEDYLSKVADQEHAGQIIETDEIAGIRLDDDLAKLGVIFTDLKTAEKKHSAILKKILGKIIDPKEGKFSSLTNAFARFGILLYVPKGLKVQKPLHSLLWANSILKAYFSHILIFLDEDSSITLVHESASKGGDEQSMHAGIVEIHLCENSHLNFIELQSLGKNVWNFSHERARLEKNSSMDWIFGAIGSHLTKNFSTIDLVGEGSIGKMSGFYFTDKDQHLDHDTQQNHNAPNTTSDLLFKGALTGSSRSVWQGMIYVAPRAFGADGYQANRNLVLSKNARADSIPGLEILADDVRCTHGATVGKIDPDQSFYLQSRGLTKQEAERLIVEGFFDPIMQRIPFEGVRNRFQKAIQEKMAEK